MKRDAMAFAIQTPRASLRERALRDETLVEQKMRAERERPPTSPPIPRREYVTLFEGSPKREASRRTVGLAVFIDVAYPRVASLQGLTTAIHRVDSRRPFPNARAELDRFAELRPGWATPDSPAIPTEVLRLARTHLKAFEFPRILSGAPLPDPWIAASEDGSIGFEWRHEGRRLLVTFEREGGIEYYAVDDLGEHSGEVGEDYLHQVLALWLVYGLPVLQLMEP